MTPSNRLPRQRRAIAPALDDPVRIVLLHAPREVFAPAAGIAAPPSPQLTYRGGPLLGAVQVFTVFWGAAWNDAPQLSTARSEEHTSELQSRLHLVCRLLLEKKKKR